MKTTSHGSTSFSAIFIAIFIPDDLSVRGMSSRVVERVLGAVGAYDALGVHPSTEFEKVKKVYRRTCLQLHPDKCKHPQATEAFQRLATLVVELQGFHEGDDADRWSHRWQQWHDRQGGQDGHVEWEEGSSCGSWGGESSDEDDFEPGQPGSAPQGAGSAQEPGHTYGAWGGRTTHYAGYEDLSSISAQTMPSQHERNSAAPFACESLGDEIGLDDPLASLAHAPEFDIQLSAESADNLEPPESVGSSTRLGNAAGGDATGGDAAGWDQTCRDAMRAASDAIDLATATAEQIRAVDTGSVDVSLSSCLGVNRSQGVNADTIGRLARAMSNAPRSSHGPRSTLPDRMAIMTADTVSTNSYGGVYPQSQPSMCSGLHREALMSMPSVQSDIGCSPRGAMCTSQFASSHYSIPLPQMSPPSPQQPSMSAVGGMSGMSGMQPSGGMCYASGMSPLTQQQQLPPPQQAMQCGMQQMLQCGMQQMPQCGMQQMLQCGMQQMPQCGMQQMLQCGMQQMPQCGMQQMLQCGMQQAGMQQGGMLLARGGGLQDAGMQSVQNGMSAMQGGGMQEGVMPGSVMPGGGMQQGMAAGMPGGGMQQGMAAGMPGDSMMAHQQMVYTRQGGVMQSGMRGGTVSSPSLAIAGHRSMVEMSGGAMGSSMHAGNMHAGNMGGGGLGGGSMGGGGMGGGGMGGGGMCDMCMGGAMGSSMHAGNMNARSMGGGGLGGGGMVCAGVGSGGVSGGMACQSNPTAAPGMGGAGGMYTGML